MAISYTKLKSGDWGVRVEGQTVTVNQVVTIRKKDGTTKQETVQRVIWTGNGVQLCAIAATPSHRVTTARSSGYQRSGGGEYCGYPCPVTGRKCCAANGPCHDCE